jgi:leucine dehydrogenase
MGAAINDATLPEIAAKAICGLANNQLAELHHSAALRARGIAYVPDYVVNGGGIGAAGQMIYSTPTREAQKQSVLRLHDTILAILAQADAENRSSSDVADEMARARMAGRVELSKCYCSLRARPPHVSTLGFAKDPNGAAN